MRGAFRWSEAGDWLAGEGWPRRAAGSPPEDEAAEALVERFRGRFHSVIAYHAGRPADPGSYRARGVLLSSPERLFADAREIFPGVDALLPEQDRSLIDGRVAFNLDERFLRECDTFYMLYGSHFLLGLACQLRRATGLDHLARLRARGTPTLLECAIPLGHLAADTIPRLCRLCIHLSSRDPRRAAFDFTIHRPLDPGRILRVEHPHGLPDHLYGRALQAPPVRARA